MYALSLPEKQEDRFCTHCGTLLTHDGFAWRCARCMERGGGIPVSGS